MTIEEQIEVKVENLLHGSIRNIKENILKAIKSGALDISSWDENSNSSLFIPKVILVALLEDQANKLKSSNIHTSKSMKDEVKNLTLFI